MSSWMQNQIDEQNDWSPNDDIDPDGEPEDFIPYEPCDDIVYEDEEEAPY